MVRTSGPPSARVAVHRHHRAPCAHLDSTVTVAMSTVRRSTIGGEWKPDPTRRHQERYHDGNSWTPRVRDRGVENEDPITERIGDLPSTSELPAPSPLPPAGPRPAARPAVPSADATAARGPASAPIPASAPDPMRPMRATLPPGPRARRGRTFPTFTGPETRDAPSSGERPKPDVFTGSVRRDEGHDGEWTAPRGRTDGAPPTVLSAQHVRVEVQGGMRILDDVSVAVAAGQMVGIVGPSGSGKSTLLKALTGSRPPDDGHVEVMGRELYSSYSQLSRSMGYVPQDDILHLQLTIRQALDFGAELRFPAGTPEEERARRIDEVLAELHLDHREDVQIDKVSGGQRKRTSVAMELLVQPRLLFLDEPTSGLDPGFERTVMELLRELANKDRAVVVVTHSLQSLHLCDRVLFLAPGGTVAFFGTPDAALRHFGSEDFIEVFKRLEAAGAESRGDHKVTSRPTPHRSALEPTVASLHFAESQPWHRQVEILVRRQIAILRADRQNLLFAAGSVVVPAILILLLMSAHSLDTGQPRPVVARELLGAVVVAAVAIGAANAVREIVKERSIYLRERSIGLRRSAYLISKLLVIGGLTCVQVAALVVITTMRSGGPRHANLLLIPHVELFFDVALTAVAAVALGLLVSTFVSSSEKGMALVPVIFVVQWLFSGAALDLQAKPVLREVAMLASSNWGMAASASTVNEHGLSQSCSYLAGRSVSDTSSSPAAEQARRDALPACDSRWRSGILQWGISITALIALVVASMYGADRVLARSEPLKAQRARDWPNREELRTILRMILRRGRSRS